VVIEDDPLVRRVLVRRLSAALNAHVTEAMDVDSALLATRAAFVNGAVLDVRLGKHLVHERLRDIRNAWPAAALVAFTGEATPEQAFELGRSGVNRLVPRRSGFDRLQRRHLVVRERHGDRAGAAGDAADQAEPLELDDHLVDRGRRDLEEPLEVGLRWWSTMEQRVRVDECQVLALLLGESAGFAAGHGLREVIQDLHEHTLSGHVDPRGTAAT